MKCDTWFATHDTWIVTDEAPSRQAYGYMVRDTS